ncbi:MAG: MerR family DNA-binding transcriptional regulator [Actinomycetota bacterium]|nr:MerR family DNA-binding transcriptional regulator [Actinomycetota bacterium]
MNRLSIGAFSERCRLPISTLRFYHEIGVLLPIEVDPITKYRYYSPAQLPTATLIAELRAVGLTPQELVAFLAAPDPTSVLSAARAHLDADIGNRQRQLQRLDRLIRDREAATRTDPPMLMTAILDWPTSRIVTASADQVVETVRRGLVRFRRDTGHLGRWAATFPLSLNTDEFEVHLHLEATELREVVPTQPVLVTRHCGPYGSLWQAYDRLVSHAQEHGLRATGRVTERYLSPHDGQPQTELLLHLLDG